MTKQEYLAMSLPHELKMVVLYYENGLESCRKIKPLTGYSQEKSPLGEYLVKVGYFRDDEFRSEKSVLPICLHLSDLTKSIEYKGEKFVPIIRLFEIAFDIKVSTDDITIDGPDEFYKITINDLEFAYSSYDNSFYAMYSGIPTLIPNQLLLFTKLFEWHFAVGLDESDYVNINTLEQNPYK